MSNNNLAIAESYYAAMNEKNMTAMEKCLHPKVSFIGPLANLKGKAAVLEGAEKFSRMLISLTIRAKFSSENQAMLAYDIGFPAPIGNIPSAVLMTFEEGLIAKIEVFFDARSLYKK